MRVGLDIGSTTIKCVVLNDAGEIVFSTYERHFSHILEKGRALLEKVAAEYLPDGKAYLAISGSAGMGLADSCKVPFVQESVIYRLDSIYTFAFPLLFGMVSGVYSTICIATPLWVDWKSKKKAAKKEA